MWKKTWDFYFVRLYWLKHFCQIFYAFFIGDMHLWLSIYIKWKYFKWKIMRLNYWIMYQWCRNEMCNWFILIFCVCMWNMWSSFQNKINRRIKFYVSRNKCSGWNVSCTCIRLDLYKLWISYLHKVKT